jgi:hypothetical protein
MEIEAHHKSQPSSFRGTYTLHLQGRKVGQAINQHEACSGWRHHVPTKSQLIFIRLYGVPSYKIEIYVLFSFM